MTAARPGESDDFARIRALFELALDQPASEREAFVRQHASDHPGLRDAVLRLLPRADEATIDVLAELPPPPALGRRDRTLPDHIGPYRIVAELGEGGMGTVFLGEHAVLGRRAAIKLVRDDFLRRPGARERFEREMRTLSQLDHKNICKVFEVGDDDGVPFMAMQWVKGETLAQLLDEARSNGPAPKARSAHAPSSSSRPSSRAEVDATLRRVEKVAMALHTAHQQGVLHRDVKPGNIMVAEDDEPIVLDFGLARAETRGDERHTSSGAIVGTLPYMAPEQVRAEDERIDRRTDVYALGVVLYECLTLQLPFQARSQTDLIREILRAAPIPARRLNRSVPFDLQVVLEKAMDPDPARRYATALAFAEDLQRVREFEPILASRLGVGLRLRRWSQRNPAAAVALVLLSTGLGIVGTMTMKLAEARERESHATIAAREGERRADLAAAGERQSRAETAMQAAALAVNDGRWHEALRHYDDAEASGHPDPVAIALGRFEAYESLARSKDAAATLDWLTRREDLGAHVGRTRLLLAVDQLDNDLAAGIATIERLLTDPTAIDLSRADREFAHSMVAQDLDEAIAHLQAARAASPRHLQTLSLLGLFLLFAGETDAALEFARDYESKYEGAIEPHLIAALAYACRGEFPVAKRQLKAVETRENRSLMRAWRKGLQMLELLDAGMLEIVRPRAVVFPQSAFGTQSSPPPTIPVPPYPFPTEDLKTMGKIAALTFEVTALPGALGRFGLVGVEGAPRLRLHPWIRRHYRKGSIQSILQLGIQLINPASYVDYFANEDAVPERFFWLCATFEENDHRLAWSMLQPGPLAEHRGITASLPSVQRLAHLYRLCTNMGSQRSGQLPTEQDAASMQANAIEDLEGALQLPGITQEELYAYLMIAVNFGFERRWNWAERFLVRWQELHGETWQWQLMRCEVLLARGLVGEARTSLESAAKLQPEHAWVASLRARLGG